MAWLGNVLTQITNADLVAGGSLARRVVVLGARSPYATLAYISVSGRCLYSVQKGFVTGALNGMIAPDTNFRGQQEV